MTTRTRTLSTGRRLDAMAGPLERQVVLLDSEARPTGSMEKLAAHQPPGRPHLAFSVMLRSTRGDAFLLQRRSSAKHHFVGLWANTCCSHPAPGEGIGEAARSRLADELGLSTRVSLDPWAGFWYRAADPRTGLVEFEYDLVLLGEIDPDVDLCPDPDEVAHVAWATADRAARLANDRTRVAPWFGRVLAVATGPRQPLPPWFSNIWAAL